MNKAGQESKKITIKVIASIGIKDLSDGLEKVAVRLLNIGSQSKLQESIGGDLIKVRNRKRIWQQTFSQMLAHTLLTESLKGSSGTPKTSDRRFRLLSKLPRIDDIRPRLNSAWYSFSHASRKVQLAIIAAVIMVAAGSYALLSQPSQAVPPVAAISHAPVTSVSLTKGTPDYKTILPTGKTIQQLGGWTRVSPKDTNAVYAYADHISSVLVDVSEQPLPLGFEVNTDAQVAQVASGYNATRKVPASGTNLYIATLADDSQAVIFAKDNLLILMKSISLLTPNQWVAYVNSLQ